MKPTGQTPESTHHGTAHHGQGQGYCDTDTTQPGTTEGGEPRLLLQIFSEKAIGPIFFEFIQRKEDDGFGEGNFEALFKSIERDQQRRGVLAEQRA